jgi:glycosyltransferase involved in cell wall biosynthesis
LRILMVTPSFLPESIGGTEIYVAGLARALMEAGDEVLIAVDSPGSASAVVEGLNVRHVGTTGATELLSQWRPDVVHAHPLTGNDILPWVRSARTRGVPVVCTYHTPTLTCARSDLVRFGEEDCDGRIDPADCSACVMQDRGVPAGIARALPSVALTLPGWVPRKVQSLLAIRRQREDGLLAWRALVESVDAWVAPAHWVANVLEINGVPRERITTVRQGTSHPPRPPQHRPRGERLVVGYLGRLHRHKGAEILLRAAREIPGAGIEIRIAGGGDAAEDARLRAEYADDARIRWLGDVPPSDTGRYLAGLDLLVVPSFVRETGPLVVLEAWAAGTPVVGSSGGGLQELLAEAGGTVFPRGDAGALAELLVRMSRGEADLPPVPREVRAMTNVSEEMRRIYSALEGACKTA